MASERALWSAAASARTAEWSCSWGRMARQLTITIVAIRPRITMTASISTRLKPARSTAEVGAFVRRARAGPRENTATSVLVHRLAVDVVVPAVLTVLAGRPDVRFGIARARRGGLVLVLLLPRVLRDLLGVEVGVAGRVGLDQRVEGLGELAAV